MTDDMLDCLIVGGGPAGLTAAIYLGRFNRRCLVIDKDEGRLSMIPISHNHAGYPEGVPGCELLAAMQAQARDYGADLRQGEVTGLTRTGGGFVAETTLGEFRARTILLATGVFNHRPDLPAEIHDEGVQRGLLRYCPICDAYEQSGKRIGVLGNDRHALAEAMFLLGFSKDVVVFPQATPEWTEDQHREAEAASVEMLAVPVRAFDLSGDRVILTLEDGSRHEVDTLYVGLGSHTRNDLGAQLGTELVDGQCFATDSQQRTSVAGVYAAGDAVEGLDQISVAMGTGGLAAVAIHNDLRKAEGLVLKN